MRMNNCVTVDVHINMAVSVPQKAVQHILYIIAHLLVAHVACVHIVVGY